MPCGPPDVEKFLPVDTHYRPAQNRSFAIRAGSLLNMKTNILPRNSKPHFLKTILAALLLAIFVPATHATLITYNVSLSGPSESPPNASSGTGFGVVTYAPPPTCWVFRQPSTALRRPRRRLTFMRPLLRPGPASLAPPRRVLLVFRWARPAAPMDPRIWI
jgi:hypothetical protein